MKAARLPIFRYIEDRIPVTIIVFLFLLDLAVFCLIENRLFIVIWALVGLAPKACICSWNHHHQHVATFRSLLLNRVMELVYAFHTGITSNAWILHHNLGHHVNYLDQSKDESRWKDGNGITMGAFRYTCMTALTGYIRAYQVGRLHPKYQRTFLTVGSVVTLLVAALLWLKPFNTTVLFLIPMLCGYVTTCWHTYYHHAGLDTADPYKASHNIMHSWYNVCTGNLGFHTAHHLKPGLHWSRLPEYHRTIAHKIPAELFVKPCIPFCWFPDRPIYPSKTKLAA